MDSVSLSPAHPHLAAVSFIATVVERVLAAVTWLAMHVVVLSERWQRRVPKRIRRWGGSVRRIWRHHARPPHHVEPRPSATLRLREREKGLEPSTSTLARRLGLSSPSEK